MCAMSHCRYRLRAPSGQQEVAALPGTGRLSVYPLTVAVACGYLTASRCSRCRNCGSAAGCSVYCPRANRTLVSVSVIAPSRPCRYHAHQLIAGGRGQHDSPGRAVLYQAGLPCRLLGRATGKVVHHHGAGLQASRRHRRGGLVHGHDRDDGGRPVGQAGLPHAGDDGGSGAEIRADVGTLRALQGRPAGGLGDQGRRPGR